MVQICIYCSLETIYFTFISLEYKYLCLEGACVFTSQKYTNMYLTRGLVYLQAENKLQICMVGGDLFIAQNIQI